MVTFRELVPQTSRVECLDVVRTARVCDEERLASGCEVIYAMSHKMKTEYHLLDTCGDNRHVDLGRQSTLVAHSLEFLHHDGMALAFGAVSEAPPDRRYVLRLLHIAISCEHAKGLAVNILHRLRLSCSFPALSTTSGSTRECS